MKRIRRQKRNDLATIPRRRFHGPHSYDVWSQVHPPTYTIDVDGVLQEEHIGDSSVEGKLKKLLERARELQSQDKGNAPLADAAAKN